MHIDQYIINYLKDNTKPVINPKYEKYSLYNDINNYVRDALRYRNINFKINLLYLLDIHIKNNISFLQNNEYKNIISRYILSIENKNNPVVLLDEKTIEQYNDAYYINLISNENNIIPYPYIFIYNFDNETGIFTSINDYGNIEYYKLNYTKIILNIKNVLAAYIKLIKEGDTNKNTNIDNYILALKNIDYRNYIDYPNFFDKLKYRFNNSNISIKTKENINKYINDFKRKSNEEKIQTALKIYYLLFFSIYIYIIVKNIKEKNIILKILEEEKVRVLKESNLTELEQQNIIDKMDKLSKKRINNYDLSQSVGSLKKEIEQMEKDRITFLLNSQYETDYTYSDYRYQDTPVTKEREADILKSLCNGSNKNRIKAAIQLIKEDKEISYFISLAALKAIGYKVAETDKYPLTVEKYICIVEDDQIPNDPRLELYNYQKQLLHYVKRYIKGKKV